MRIFNIVIQEHDIIMPIYNLKCSNFIVIMDYLLTQLFHTHKIQKYRLQFYFLKSSSGAYGFFGNCLHYHLFGSCKSGFSFVIRLTLVLFCISGIHNNIMMMLNLLVSKILSAWHGDVCQSVVLLLPSLPLFSLYINGSCFLAAMVLVVERS